MATSTVIVLWTLAFAATHMGFAAMRVRPRLVSAIGEPAYLGIYSLVSFATFVPLVRAWLGGIHGGPRLWNLRDIPVIHATALLVSWLTFTLALASFAQASPVGLDPRAPARPRGLTRITRHPLFMNIGIWALAHVLLNGWLNDVLFFGGVFLVGLLGCMHQDARKRISERGKLDEFYAETSLLPFGAIIAGRNRLVVTELPWIGIAMGAISSWLIYHYHTQLFL